MNLRLVPMAAAVLAASLSWPSSAQAHQAGDWLLRLGVHMVDPKSDNGSLAGGALAADVDSNARPTLMIERMLTNQLGIELIAAVPFRHDIALNGAHAGSTKHLPPTLSLQWHFNPTGTVQPYLGGGVNYTWFDGEKSAGPIEGTTLKLGNSWGLAAHAGIDFRIDERWFAGFDVRWIDIDTEVKVDGANVGSVQIDPIVYGAYVGIRF
ncbi:MAG: outer membrane beta-barrel protein [Xanthomonadales bacterium]|nr:outer membrane beta-barrel protein [Xanthomonadales bacterium]